MLLQISVLNKKAKHYENLEIILSVEHIILKPISGM